MSCLKDLGITNQASARFMALGIRLRSTLCKLLCSIFVLMSLSSVLRAQQISPLIKVNQVGYLTSESKFASVSSEEQLSVNTWHIYDLDKEIIAYSGSGYNTVVEDIPTEEYVYQLEFSGLADLGNYYVFVDGIGRSHDFLISPTV